MRKDWIFLEKSLYRKISLCVCELCTVKFDKKTLQDRGKHIKDFSKIVNLSNTIGKSTPQYRAHVQGTFETHIPHTGENCEMPNFPMQCPHRGFLSKNILQLVYHNLYRFSKKWNVAVCGYRIVNFLKSLVCVRLWKFTKILCAWLCTLVRQFEAFENYQKDFPSLCVGSALVRSFLKSPLVEISPICWRLQRFSFTGKKTLCWQALVCILPVMGSGFDLVGYIVISFRIWAIQWVGQGAKPPGKNQ